MRGSGTSDPVRVGLAGLGRFGKLHASILGNLPGAELVAVCDPRADAVAEIGDRFDVPGRYESLDLMLADRPDLDAVFLVTPEPLHAAQAEAVIERGLSLFVEKPLAPSAGEGERLIAKAAAAGVLLQTGFVLRFETRHAMLKSQIAAGQFGALVSLRAKRNCSRAWFPVYGDRVHPVYETSIHDIDLLLWLTGCPVVSVYALEHNVSGLTYPDGCWAMLQFANGAVATVETSWFVPEGAPANVLADDWHGAIDSTLEVVGVERTARITSLDADFSIWQDAYSSQPETSLWPEIDGAVGGALRDQDRHFIACVRSGKPSPIASAADAVSGLRIADAIVESARIGQPVRLAGLT